MEAGDWEELDFLMKAAGIPADQVMGYSDDEEYPIPSPKTFQENLKVHVMGEELTFPYPDLREFEVYGTQDMEDELFTPPPFMDMEEILKPMQLSPEAFEEAERLFTQLKEMKETKDKGETIVETPGRNEEHANNKLSPPSVSKDDSSDQSTPELATGTFQQTGRAQKRCRESDEDDSSATPNFLEQDTNSNSLAIVIPSSSGSSADDSLIDLTQK